jgi:hypothetical protein
LQLFQTKIEEGNSRLQEGKRDPESMALYRNLQEFEEKIAQLSPKIK